MTCGDLRDRLLHRRRNLRILVIDDAGNLECGFGVEPLEASFWLSVVSCCSRAAWSLLVSFVWEPAVSCIVVLGSMRQSPAFIVSVNQQAPNIIV